MADIKAPGVAEMQNRQTLATHIIQQQQQGVHRGARTTLSMNGSRQLNVTAQSLSDVMQGTMAVRGPEELDLILNKALTNNLDYLYESDYRSASAFSTAKYEITNPGAEGSGEYGTGSSLASGWMGDENTVLDGKYVAQIAAQVGFTENGKPELWRMVGLANRESGWRPKATNSATSDRGLWQINMSAHGKTLVTEGILTGDGYEVWTPQLHDPVINGRAVYQIVFGRGGDPMGNYSHAWGAGPDGWVSGGDPMYGVDQNQAKDAVARAKAEGLLGKPFMPVVGGGNFSAGGGGPFDGNFQALAKAGQIIANHKNNLMAKNSGFGNILTSGSSGDVSMAHLKDSSGRGWLFPSLYNYLFIILESGFLIDNYLGSFVKKRKKFNPSEWSNHSYGGAVDFSGLGLASEGRVYGGTSSQHRAIGDKLWTLLSTLPKGAWAEEHGWNFGKVYYGSEFHTYNDPGHIHLGFNREQTGTLMSALMR